MINMFDVIGVTLAVAGLAVGYALIGTDNRLATLLITASVWVVYRVVSR